ncbi:lipoprotein [Treponema vincentii]|uniref:lipoprotein n=1 Tax=Treponema vincentii TaxID=69710 RepID=UPI003D8CDB12
MKKYLLFILSALLLTACSSCDLLFNNTKQKDTEPVYTPNYAWKLELDGMQIQSQAYTEDNYLYLLQNIEREKEDGVQLIKIDMETGVYVWKADQIFDGHQWYSSNIVKACNKLYFMRKNGIIYCYSDVDGTLLARIQVGTTEQEALHNTYRLETIVTDGTALYWGSAGEPGSISAHLLKLDLDAIDYTQNGAIQIRVPRSLYTKADWRQCTFWSAPIIDDNVLYFNTFNIKHPDGYSSLAAIDLQSETVKWEKKLHGLRGRVNNDLIIKDNILYMLDTTALLRLDKHTGEVLTRYDDEKDPPYTQPLMIPTVSLCGIWYDDGRLYYTTVGSTETASQTGMSKDLVYSVVCIDAKTLKFLWGFHPVSGTSSTYPVVKDGKAYIVTHIDGLRVFDAKTGKLLGVDKSIIAWGDEANVLYKDYFIFFNKNFKTNRATLCAIRV